MNSSTQMPTGAPHGAPHDEWWAAMLAAAPAHMLQRAASFAASGHATSALGAGSQRAHPMRQDHDSIVASTCPPQGEAYCVWRATADCSTEVHVPAAGRRQSL